jgi:Peptidase family M23
MDTRTAHISRRCRPIVASAVIVCALLLSIATRAPSASGTPPAGAEFTQTRSVAHGRGVPPSYGWPVKPFNRQHPVRAYLNDPRNGNGAKDFHFGIDISAPNGTAVYSVEPGVVSVGQEGTAIWVRGATRTFSYWHINPVVRTNQFVGTHQLIGHIERKYNPQHVHFAEMQGGQYVNPLRPGGLGPYVDRTPPTTGSVRFFANGRELDAHALKGRVQLIAEVFDTQPLPVPEPWSNLPLTPAVIRWSIVHGSRIVVAPQTVVNSTALYPKELYDSIYAPSTFQNRRGHPGHYRYRLGHGLDSTLLPKGVSQLRIVAADTRGNHVLARVEISRTGSRR